MKHILFLSAVMIGAGVSARSFSYSAGTTPYKWSTSVNWSSDGFPAQDDSVTVSQSALLQSPLHVDQDVTISNLFLDVGTLYVDEGRSLTAQKNNSGVINLGQCAGACAVITNKGAITTYTFDLGTYNKAQGVMARVDNFGSITIANHLRMGVAGTPSVFYNHDGATVEKKGGSIYTFYVGVGEGGHTKLINDGEFLDSSSEVRMGLQSSQKADCELLLNKSGYFYVKNVLSVGDAAWSSPRVELNDVSRLVVAGKLNVGGANSNGANTSGTVTLNDSSVLIASNDVIVARNQNSNGKIYLKGNSRLRQEKGSLIIANGISSSGSVYVEEEAELSATNIVIAANTTSTKGLLEVSGTLTNLTRIKVGCNSATSHAELKLSGGRLWFNGNHIDPLWLNERRTKVAGVVRGWGTVAMDDPRRFITDWQKHKDETGYSRPITLVHYGQIIADGGVLDFGRFGALSHRTTEANPSGTNGWLAVNHGVLRLPRCHTLSESGRICIGDCPDLDYSQEFSDAVRSNRLANTFSCAFNGNVSGGYVFSELYAADHADVPQGVSQFAGPGGRVLAVWRIGCFSDGPEATDPSNPVAFDSAKIHFRHMNDNLDGMVRTYVCRHSGTENGQWRIAGSTKTRKGWPVVSASVGSPASGKWNLGWFAVVAREKPFGAFIVVR